jgi:hypothetical protein
MAESSIKRIFAKGDMPLSRIDEVLAVLKMDFADLAARVLHAQPLRKELTLEQEKAVVADRKLLLVAICALSQWTFEQIVSDLHAERGRMRGLPGGAGPLGIIELRPLNRYRLKMDKTFRWRPDGPGDDLLPPHVVDDYFSGGFDGEGETLMLVHGQIGKALAAHLRRAAAALGQDFAQQHLADQKLPPAQKRPTRW